MDLIPSCRYCSVNSGFLLESKGKIYCIRCVLSGEVTNEEVAIEDHECVFFVKSCKKSNQIRNRKRLEGEWICGASTLTAKKFVDESKAYPLAFKKTMECETCLVYPILVLSFQKQSKIRCLSCFLKLSLEEQKGFMVHLPKLPSIGAAVSKRIQTVLNQKGSPETKLNNKYVAHSIVKLANSVFQRASGENQSVAVVLSDPRFLSSILDLSMVAHGLIDTNEGLKLLRYSEDTMSKEMLVPFRSPRNPQRTFLVGSDMKSHSLLVKSKNNPCHFLFGNKPDILLIGEFQTEIKDALFLLNCCTQLLKQQLQKLNVSFGGFQIMVIPLDSKEARPLYDWNQTSLDEPYVSEQWISKMTKEMESENVVVCRPVGNDVLKLFQPSPFGLYSFDGSVLEFAIDGTSEFSLKPMEKIIPPQYRFVHTVLKQFIQRYIWEEEKMGQMLNQMTSSVFENKDKKDERMLFLMGLIQIENIPLLKQKEVKEEKEEKEQEEMKEMKEMKEIKEVNEIKEIKEIKEVKEIKEIKEINKCLKHEEGNEVKEDLNFKTILLLYFMFFLVFIAYFSFFGVLIDFYFVA